MSDTRKYVSFHNLAAQQLLSATVVWNGEAWKVALDDEIVPDCCDTIEQAYTVVEREIERRFPGHSCQHSGCKPWQHFSDAAG